MVCELFPSSSVRSVSVFSSQSDESCVGAQSSPVINQHHQRRSSKIQWFFPRARLCWWMEMQFSVLLRVEWSLWGEWKLSLVLVNLMMMLLHFLILLTSLISPVIRLFFVWRVFSFTSNENVFFFSESRTELFVKIYATNNFAISRSPNWARVLMQP